MTKSTEITPVETMDLDGGDPSLDFVNTASGRDGGPLQDKLDAYADLVTWAERVELIGDDRGRLLRAEAARSPDEAGSVLARARALREAIFRLFARTDADPADLDLLAAEAARAAAEQRIVPAPDGYTFAFPESTRLEQVLWPVALSAAELLISADRERVKECASETCDWLFLDESRNRSRRWCNMKVCGNRAKARRFSARHRTT